MTKDRVIMKQKYNIIFLAVLSAVVSCVQMDEAALGEEQEQREMISLSVSATIEKDLQTKTALEGSLSDASMRTVWVPSDKIGLVASRPAMMENEPVVEFVTGITENSETADFEGTIAFASEYHAFYPYQSTLRDSCGVFIFSLPQEQKYVAGSFDPTAAPMVAKTPYGETLDFQNLCGLLALQIKGEETVKSITFIGKDQFGAMMPVSGKHEVNMYYENEPSIVSKSNQRSVTLTCDTPVVLNQDAATPFYFVLPPATYSSFFIMIHTTDGKVMFREGTNPLTVSRSHVKPTAALKYAESIYIDLSEIGWSNCYIVPQAGLYSFDATVIGNGEYGLDPEVKFHTDNVKIDPKKVELLWEDRENLITGLTLKDGEVRFFSTGIEGNALVAVKDESGKVLWSWHLWMTDQPQDQVYVNDFGTFTMLDRNNGAIRADQGEGEQWREAQGVLYQWGRKDPFTTRGFYGEQLFITNSARAQISDAIELPTVFEGAGYNGWEMSDNAHLWSAYQKTIYDPCPVGYRMPTSEVWRGFTVDGQNKDGSSDEYRVPGSFNNGWHFYYNDAEVTYYPITCHINDGGGFGWGDSYNRMWTASHRSKYQASYFYYYYYSDSSSAIYFDSESNKVNGFAVRCMKDEAHVDTSYPSVVVREVVDVTSESATVVAEVFNEGISEVTERGLVWGLNDNLTVDNGTKVVAEVAGAGEYRTAFTGLQNATVYYVRPYAINSRGLSYGKVTSFRTTYAGEANNLSAYGTSNCYIVEPAYSKHYINGSVKGHTYESIGSVSSVEVLWETNGYGMKTEPGSVIFDVTLKDGNIYFYTNGVEGNALIASKDAMGTILWSWHIWVTDTPKEQIYGIYNVLDRNLGAVSADEGAGDEWKLSCGLMYQPERKDPFAGCAFTREYAYYSVDEAVAHPTVYDYNWNSEDRSGFWLTTEKTVYDPCPVGYRVVVNDVWNGIQSVPGNGHGAYFYFDSNPSARFWYPVGPNYSPDGVSYWEEIRMISAEEGYFWGNGNDHFHLRREYGMVRCMKDAGYIDMSYPTVKMNVTTDISSVGAKINAEITNTGIAEITSRGFIWGTSEDLSPENGTKIDCGSGSGKFAATLDNLSHSTRYYVMAYATNERGTSYSNVVSFFTPYEGSAVNLSKDGTANCYIVPVAYSEYAFNASVKGNSDESVGKIAEAVVLWETRNDRNTIEVGDVIESVTFDGNNVHFFLPSEPVPGNALIAVKDALGTILWSWHIWVVDFDPVATQQTYISGAVMMDRNLGALNAIPGDLGSFGLMYQWGRKDPFVGSGVTYNDGRQRAFTAPSDAIRYEYYNSSTDTIENAVKNPTIVYNDARWSEATDLWGYKKTKYDPCPAGWRVSDLSAWEGLGTYNSQNYLVAEPPYSTPVAYFPTTGHSEGDEYIWEIANGAKLWLTEHRRYVDMWWDRNPELYNTRDVDYMHSVRCMKDYSDNNGDNEDYTEGDDYEW